MEKAMKTNSEENFCIICRESIKSPVGIPDGCSHKFCFECLMNWAKYSTHCPVDRQAFNIIHKCLECNGPAVEDVSILSSETLLWFNVFVFHF